MKYCRFLTQKNVILITILAISHWISMNTEQLKLLRDAAKLIETDRSWSAINRFTTLANPQDIVELCDELLALRAGNSKTPSIKPSKQALENLLNADVLIPSCDKIKNGYAIRYSGFTYDENDLKKVSYGPSKNAISTKQEKKAVCLNWLRCLSRRLLFLLGA